MVEKKNLIEIWGKVFTAYPILREKGELNVKSEDVTELINVISPEDKPLVIVIEDMIFNKISQHMTRHVAPEFWRHFSNRENELDGFNRFKDATCSLYASLSEYLSLIENIELLRKHVQNEGRVVYGEKTAMESFKVIVRGTIHSQLQVNYEIILEDFYKISFKVFCNSDKSKKDHDSTEDLVQCGGCVHEMEQCRCKYIIQVFHDTNRKLIELELLERLAGNVITQIIRKRIESHVQETCKGSFDTSYLNSLELWLETVVMRWLQQVYSAGATTPFNLHAPQVVDKFLPKLLYFLYETYTRTRIDQLFNIIIEYPDSQPAVEDLRQCLQRTDLQGYLTRKLQGALETRLLHPGVNTPDILTAYVAAIRALRQLDPSGVLLETVTKPVRQYLRHRDDTVRCVVSSLTEEPPSELADELGRGEALQLDEGVPSDGKMENWQKWNPTPIHADPSRLSKHHRTSDIISMLVNVYGSKEVFINEYRNLLADRLLSQVTYSTEKEMRNLELLKLRFGESQLHYCEVMLKDVNDSKRINAHLHSDTNSNFDSQSFPTTAMILSAQFWPPFKEETLKLPTFVKEHLKVYTKAFETLKGNRTLNWKPHLGSVNLDIELKDRKLSLIVSPIHATIIWHFQAKSEWTVDELSHVMQVPPTVLRRKIAYWQSQGLLREVATDQFLLVEDSSPRSKDSKEPASTDMVCDDEESESAMASAHDQREEELQVFWSYIVGMLTNLDSMPLERIHQMLKMFASQGPTAVECSLQELRQFLDRKVKEHKLVLSSGFYRLPKA